MQTNPTENFTICVCRRPRSSPPWQRSEGGLVRLLTACDDRWLGSQCIDGRQDSGGEPLEQGGGCWRLKSLLMRNGEWSNEFVCSIGKGMYNLKITRWRPSGHYKNAWFFKNKKWPTYAWMMTRISKFFRRACLIYIFWEEDHYYLSVLMEVRKVEAMPTSGWELRCWSKLLAFVQQVRNTLCAGLS